MNDERRLRIGISVGAPNWLQGSWRRPDSEIEKIFSGKLGIEMARRAEAQNLDFVLHTEGSSFQQARIEHSFHGLNLNASMHLAMIAQATSRIGLVPTIATTFENPWSVARQLMTLSWISEGRAGWNVVTAFGGHRNFGFKEEIPSNIRYERALEFVAVVHRLWDTFPPDALLMNRETGQFADASLIQPIDKPGNHFDIKGPLTIPSYPARIPIMLSGESPNGMTLAARIADLVFTIAPEFDRAVAMRARLSDSCASLGRDPRSVKLLPGLRLFLGRTREAAQEAYDASLRDEGQRVRLANLRALLGVRFATWPLDRRVTLADIPPTFTTKLDSRLQERLVRHIELEQPTLAELLKRNEAAAWAHWTIIGTPEDAVDEVSRWFEAGAIDGFVLFLAGHHESVDLVFEEFCPKLKARGLLRTSYSGQTFMSHLEERTGTFQVGA